MHMTEKTFTLEELAEDFDLTPRTARHYIENLLPEHHKTGRGKVARYGMDTWHCFAFIRRAKEEGLTNQQIADALFINWMNAYNQTEIRSVIETQWLTLDDDDGNIDNGTPHYPEINQGFLELATSWRTSIALSALSVLAGWGSYSRRGTRCSSRRWPSKCCCQPSGRMRRR